MLGRGPTVRGARPSAVPDALEVAERKWTVALLAARMDEYNKGNAKKANKAAKVKKSAKAKKAEKARRAAAKKPEKNAAAAEKNAAAAKAKKAKKDAKAKKVKNEAKNEDGVLDGKMRSVINIWVWKKAKALVRVELLDEGCEQKRGWGIAAAMSRCGTNAA